MYKLSVVKDYIFLIYLEVSKYEKYRNLIENWTQIFELAILRVYLSFLLV